MQNNVVLNWRIEAICFLTCQLFHSNVNGMPWTIVKILLPSICRSFDLPFWLFLAIADETLVIKILLSPMADIFCNAEQAEKIMGHSPAGLFGYTHMLGGYAGGQAEYLRVPYADVGPIKVPDGLPDEQVVFLSDIFPTGYMAAENCDIQSTDTVAVWGCGPVGQFAIQSAWMLGAKRVIAIDNVPERLEMARSVSKAEVIDYEKSDVYETLQEWTKGRGPDCCIDAVGAENHAAGNLQSALDDAKTALHLGSDRPHVLNEIFKCCRKGGRVSVPGVYFSSVSLQWGTAMNKALQIRLGQTHMQRYLTPLMEKITNGEIDPSFVITHVEPLDNAPEAYKKFRDKEDGCIKVVLKP